MAEAIVSRPDALPVGPVKTHGMGWNGILCLIASEAALFGYLLFGYYYTAASSPPGWLLEPEPSLRLSLPDTILLVLSSVVAWWGERGMKRRRRRQALLGVGGAFAMGVVFVIVQMFEWKAKSFGLHTSSYASLYFVTTGFHLAHVVIGLLMLASVFLWTWLGYFGPERRMSASIPIIYWHFVDAVWLFVFTTYYVTPYLGFGK